MIFTFAILLIGCSFYQNSSDELDIILNKHYKAVNQGNRNGINTLKISGTQAFYIDEASYKQKKKFFTEKFQQQTIKNYAHYEKIEYLKNDEIAGLLEYCIKGSSAWKRDGYGVQNWVFGSADSINLNKTLDIEGHLYNWKRKGHLLTFIGDRKIENIDYKCLKMITSNGYKIYYYIEPDSWLIRYLTYYGEFSNDYKYPCYHFADYKKKSGVTFPYMILYRTSSMGEIITNDKLIKEIIINDRIDAEIYNKPLK